jgi:hypothetical protein
VIVKWFASKRAAEAWAEQFAYARDFSKLPPLEVVFSDDHWGVENPDYPAEQYLIDQRGRVRRRGPKDEP